MEEKEKETQEFSEMSISQVVMKAAQEYADEGEKQITEPMMNYIKGIMQAAFFSGAYWITHMNENEVQMEEKPEEPAESLN